MNCKDEVSTYFHLPGMENLPQIVEECENWLNSFPRNKFQNPKKLTHDEMFAIAMFTHELRPQGKEYENFYFQLKFTNNLKQFGGYMYYRKMAMSHFEDQQMKVYRGFPSSNLGGIQKIYSNSQQISLTNFISTTTDIALAQKAAEKGGIIMEINIFTGKNITEYAFLKNKSEIILSPNMVFIVSEELHKEDDGYFHLKLTQTLMEGRKDGRKEGRTEGRKVMDRRKVSDRRKEVQKVGRKKGRGDRKSRKKIDGWKESGSVTVEKKI